MESAASRQARLDPGLRALLGELVPLRFDDGGSRAEDRPGHVRGASAIVRDAERLVIVQDDVRVLALRAADGTIAPLLLPADEDGVRTFDDGRANKHRKLDLEACVRLPDGRLLALGSGSTRARERLVVVEPGAQATGPGREPGARIVEASDLYAGLRAARAFSGSELNVEGAVVVGDALRLFQRGNGAPRGGIDPVSATAELALPDFLAWLDAGAAAPRPMRIVRFDLGDCAGTPFGFTDASLLPDGRIAFLACAEASPDTVRDGEVLGCRFGIIDDADVRTVPIVDAAGRPVREKLEGLCPRPGRSDSFDVVVDMDRADEPARLGGLAVSGG